MGLDSTLQDGPLGLVWTVVTQVLQIDIKPVLSEGEFKYDDKMFMEEDHFVSAIDRKGYK